ncbi:MAG: hypothetical protein K0R65_2738 [Crocinitomicaceae bacterium]|jgi:hypothetical protein|nr:hypothetical protein [Crocinitomicaceae bacterium]
MRVKKILWGTGKILLFVTLISTGLLISGFYTHPSFMEEQISQVWPSFKKTQFNRSFQEFKEQQCSEYRSLASQLNDKYFDYIWNSAYQKFGDVIKTKDQIRPYYLEKKLILVDSSDVYVVDSLFHSYAFLTKDAKILLDDLGKRFQEKIRNTSFRNARILVTSLLRTESTVKRLMRRNRNSLRISSHLHGTTFDIAHNEFVADQSLNEAEIAYLREILAETLNEFRAQDRCFVTYEMNQACFHVVNKKSNS